MANDPPNPYINLRLDQLAVACNAKASDLLRGNRVSRRDLAYLLLAAARATDPRDLHGSPYQKVSRDRWPPSTLWPEYEQALRGLRYRLITEAIQAARELPRDHGALVARSQQSDEGLRAGLAELDRLGGQGTSADDLQHPMPPQPIDPQRTD